MTEEEITKLKNLELTKQAFAQGLSQLPGAEPTLAQLDEWQRDQLIELCYEIVPMLNEEGKVLLDEMNRPVWKREVKYPDILALITSIGHLEGTSNYTWEQAQWMFLDWESLEWEPILRKHERDHLASDLLYIIKGVKRRQIFGDSQGGSRQDFIVKVGGSDRMMRLLTGEGEKKKRGFLGLW